LYQRVGTGPTADEAWHQNKATPGAVWVNEALEDHRPGCYRPRHLLLRATERNVKPKVVVAHRVVVVETSLKGKTQRAAPIVAMGGANVVGC
jgi:hypothetical protein